MAEFFKRNFIFLLCLAAIVLLLVRVLFSGSDPLAAEAADDTALLEKGWDRFENMDSEAALVCFGSVLEAEDATLVHRQQAMYGLILANEYFYPDVRPEAALTWIDRFMQQFPDSELVPWVLLEKGYLLGRISAEREVLRDLFRDIIEQYPQSEAIHEAVLALSHTYFTEMDRETADQGIEILKNHLANYPDSHLERILLYRISYRMAETNLEYEKALPYARQLGEMKMCDPFRWGMQFWLLGQIYNRHMDQPQEAIYWYRKIIEECEHDQRIYSAKQMIEKLQER